MKQNYVTWEETMPHVEKHFISMIVSEQRLAIYYLLRFYFFSFLFKSNHKLLRMEIRNRSKSYMRNLLKKVTFIKVNDSLHFQGLNLVYHCFYSTAS